MDLARTDGRVDGSARAVIAPSRGEAAESALGVCTVPLLGPSDGGSTERVLGFRSYPRFTRWLFTRRGVLQAFLTGLVVRSLGVRHHPSSAVGLPAR